MPEPSPFPPGVMRSIVFHWTAGDYRTAFASYHFCVGLLDGEAPAVLASADVRKNMRDTRTPGEPYAAHTSGRNGHAIGLAICAMEDATPSDFGRFPLRDDFVDVACALAADLCIFYDIAVDARHVYTHAEAAVDDGYFGCGNDERWDIARLRPSTEALQPADARATGDALRANVLRAIRARE